MEKKVIPYGTEYQVEVESANERLITVIARSISEGFFLMGHGIKDLPKPGDKGKIVFTKGGPMKGYWKYYPSNPKQGGN